MEKVINADLMRRLDQYKGFGIGLHGVGTERTKLATVEDTLDAIMQNGLKLGSGYGSINGNVFSAGVVGKNDDEISRKLTDYAWGSGKQTNVIVAYPAVIENQYGEKLYLGFTESPKGYDQDTKCSMMDVACAELGYIPKEFILGYYIDSDNRYGRMNPGEEVTYDFEENPDFCKGSLVSDELFRKMGDALRYSKQLSTACAKAIDTSDVTEVAGIMKSELRFAKLFNTTDTIEFMRRTFKDVSDRIMDKEREKGVEFTDNSEYRNQLFDDEAR